MRINVSHIGRGMEKGFLILGLFLFSGAFFPLLGQKYEVFNSILKLLKFTVYFLTLLFSVFYFRTVSKAFRRDLLTWLLVGHAILSVSWSWFPADTLQKAMDLVIITFFGMYLGSRFEFEKMLRILAGTMLLFIVLSIVYALAFPEFGIDHDSAWQGVFTHKNSLGRIMVLSAITFVFLSTNDRNDKEIKDQISMRVWFFLSMLLMLLSTSKTALLVCSLLLLYFFVLKMMRQASGLKVSIFIGILLGFGAFLVWFLEDTETFFGLIGKDMTLTGRTELWEAVIYMIQKEYWLGYGYFGFWKEMEGPSAYVWEITGWNPPHSHNGILDLWLDLGLIGVIIFVMGLLRNLYRAMRRYRRNKTIFDLWPLMYVAFMIFYNITEVTLLNNAFFWSIYVATSVSLTLQAKEGVIE